MVYYEIASQLIYHVMHQIKPRRYDQKPKKKQKTKKKKTEPKKFHQANGKVLERAQQSQNVEHVRYVQIDEALFSDFDRGGVCVRVFGF